jgi:integral membrane protein
MRMLLSKPLSRLRFIGLLEGCTLLILVAIAAPLRHLAGFPIATRVMGPIHGFVFILYLVALIDCISGGAWTAREIARGAFACLVPFGTFLNDGLIRRKIAQAEA